MKPWEFLIQQEGDCTWLPIQQPILELTAGNYRLVAHVSRPHLDVDIHITHEIEEGGQTGRYCQSYSRHTNAEGLITIFPLMELKPGNWQITCYGDLMSELLGESWQESLQLQVMPAIATISSEPGKQESKEEREKAEQEAMEIFAAANSSSESASAVELEVNSDSKNLEIEELQFNTDLDSENDLITSDPTSFDDIFAPALRLSLERDTLIRSQGEGIPITGKVEAVVPHPPDFPLSGTLRLQLKNADSDQILLVREYPLPAQTLPFNFSHTLDLSPDEEIPLLAGEAILEGVGGTCLARQSFTVATDINCLDRDSDRDREKHLNYIIELATTEGDSSFAFDLLIPEEIATASLPLNLAEPTKMNKQRRPLAPKSHSVDSVLPPKITRSSGEKSIKRPQLPKLPPLRQPQQPVDALSEEAVEINTELPTEKIPESTDNRPQVMADEEAFQSLKFKDRFLSRLNSMATEA